MDNGIDIKIVLANDPGMRDHLMDDLNYLKNRIRTYRAVNPDTVDTHDSRYIDAAVTLVTLFKYILWSRNDLTMADCTVNIQPKKQSSLTSSGMVIVPRCIAGSSEPASDFKVPISVRIIFTDRKTAGNPTGMFMICIETRDREYAQYIGDASLADAYDMPLVDRLYNRFIDEIITGKRPVDHLNDMPSGVNCFLANSNGALRYCENFPSPTSFMKMVNDAITGVIAVSKMV